MLRALLLLLIATPTLAQDQSMWKKPELRALENYVFDHSPEGMRTDALLVQHDGKIIYERYERGYSASMKHISWSMAKTVSAALIGIAEQQGILKRSDPLKEFYPDLPPIKGAITVSNLLTMTSGIGFNELYEKGPELSDTVAMLYRDGIRDTARYVLGCPQIRKPGEHFYYSSGDSNVAMDILRRKLSPSDYESFPDRVLFSPLGITDYVFERDHKGTFLGSSYLYLTARDFSKIGELYRDGGVFKNKRVVPAAWTEFQKKLSTGIVGDPNRGNPDLPFGADLWLNIEVPENHTPRPYPSAPPDTIMLLGHSGQIIIIIPSLKLVVVRLAEDFHSIHRDYFLSLLFKALAHGPSVPDLYTGVPDRFAYDGDNPLSDPTEATVIEPAPPATQDDPPPSRSSLALPQIGSAYAAKEYCSCRYVVGQSDAFCRQSVYEGVPFLSFKADDAAKSVDVRALYGHARAHWTGTHTGCLLD